MVGDRTKTGNKLVAFGLVCNILINVWECLFFLLPNLANNTRVLTELSGSQITWKHELLSFKGKLPAAAFCRVLSIHRVNLANKPIYVMCYFPNLFNTKKRFEELFDLKMFKQNKSDLF